MAPEQILKSIEAAGAWLPATTLRQAFEQSEALKSALLDAVGQRAREEENSMEVCQQRLAAFGVFFLAQHRERRLLEPLIRLFESVDPEQQGEWLFGGRLFFFGHRLLAGVCPLDAQPPTSIALHPNLRSMTRSMGLCAVGLLAAYGDITRAEAVSRLRTIFEGVRSVKDEFMDCCWARTASKVHSREFERELQRLLASGRLSRHARLAVGSALRQHPDANFATIVALEGVVDLFMNVFPQDMRNGEIGFVPNGQIPRLDLFEEDEPKGEN